MMIDYQIVAIYRKCCLCDVWKKLAEFRGAQSACRRCTEIPLGSVGRNALSRSLVLTEKGRTAARAA